MQPARAAGPAEDAVPLISDAPPSPGDWDAEPASTSIDVFADFAPALGQAFGEARDRGELLFGFAEHMMRTTYLGSSTGLRLRHDQPTGRVELNGKTPDFGRSVWGGTGEYHYFVGDVIADAELSGPSYYFTSRWEKPLLLKLFTTSAGLGQLVPLPAGCGVDASGRCTTPAGFEVVWHTVGYDQNICP